MQRIYKIFFLLFIPYLILATISWITGPIPEGESGFVFLQVFDYLFMLFDLTFLRLYWTVINPFTLITFSALAELKLTGGEVYYFLLTLILNALFLFLDALLVHSLLKLIKK